VKRGEMYRVCRGAKNDPKEHRVFVIVSRQMLIDYVGTLSNTKMEEVNTALRIALAVE